MIIEAAKNPFDVLAGKTSYQRLIVECFLFATKFTSQCMYLFEDEYSTIFDKVIEVLEEFLKSNTYLNGFGRTLKYWYRLENMNFATPHLKKNVQKGKIPLKRMIPKRG